MILTATKNDRQGEKKKFTEYNVQNRVNTPFTANVENDDSTVNCNI